jgi:C4-dicarboxylate-specific signal transduction histidine kinase
MKLYARLAGALILQRRERVHRMMSVDEATSAIAHELRQPLAAMLLNCDAGLGCLETENLDLEELRSCFSDVKRDSTRANEILSGVRALFRSVPDRRTTFEINSLVREVLRMVENDVRVQGISISPELEENLPQIAGDQIQLQQVILNLVKNAIDALALLGLSKIKAIRVVTTRGLNSSVSILVQDNGPGIIAETETNIFDPFFTTKSSGMGLGLSISRRIIEDHNGSLRLTETSSKGCTFEITLPAQQ